MSEVKSFVSVDIFPCQKNWVTECLSAQFFQYGKILFFFYIFLHKNVTFFPNFSCRKTNGKYIIFHTFFFSVKYTILYKRKMGIKWFILILFFLLRNFSFFFRKNILETHDMFPNRFFPRKNVWSPGVHRTYTRECN